MRLERKAVSTRRGILDRIYRAQSGHPGGSLSAVEIVVSLYYHHMRIRPEEPDWEGRDRFILSKGHAAPLLYTVLADRGFFPAERLEGFRRCGGMLQGHPDRAIPGVEMSSGSLGQGLSVGIGLALGGAIDGAAYRTFVLLGDGECNEGQVWEAAMFAAKMRLPRLVAIVDRNGVQLDGPCEEIMPLGDLRSKWRAFGWRVIAVDGHSFPALLGALAWSDSVRGPVVILADTIKGCGVSFMEGDHRWHGRIPDAGEYRRAQQELGGDGVWA